MFRKCVIFVIMLQSSNVYLNLDQPNRSNFTTNHQPRKRKFKKNPQEKPSLQRTPTIKQRLKSIQHDIDLIKSQIMLNLQEPIDKRNMSIIPQAMQKIYNDIFKQVQIIESEEDKISLKRKQPFLQLDPELKKHLPEVVKALADISYIWFVYDTILQKDHKTDTSSLFLPEDIKLMINGKSYSYSAHDWALSAQQAGFKHPSELKPEIIDTTVKLMKPSSTFETINTALHYGGYLITKAAEFAWFYAPEQVFGIPKDLVRLQYYSDPYRVHADNVATYQDYVEPAARATLKYATNPHMAYHDAIAAYHGYVKPVTTMIRHKLFNNQPAQRTTFTQEAVKEAEPL